MVCAALSLVPLAGSVFAAASIVLAVIAFRRGEPQAKTALVASTAVCALMVVMLALVFFFFPDF